MFLYSVHTSQIITELLQTRYFGSTIVHVTKRICHIVVHQTKITGDKNLFAPNEDQKWPIDLCTKRRSCGIIGLYQTKISGDKSFCTKRRSCGTIGLHQTKSKGSLLFCTNGKYWFAPNEVYELLFCTKRISGVTSRFTPNTHILVQTHVVRWKFSAPSAP